MSLLAPPCPDCGKAIPFKKTQWGLGTPFECAGCKAQLVIPKNTSIGLFALCAFWLLRDRMQSTQDMVILICGLAVAILILTRILLTPRTVGPGDS